MGGEQRDDDASFEVTGARREFTLPESAWLRLRANAGHWWTVFALEDGGRRVRRATSVRAFVRHADIPRVEGSRLYGKAPPMYHFSGTDTPPMPASPAS
jgi:hypothetical protein